MNEVNVLANFEQLYLHLERGYMLQLYIIGQIISPINKKDLKNYLIKISLYQNIIKLIILLQLYIHIF